MGSLPFWIGPPFFGGSFFWGNDSMRFQDLTFSQKAAVLKLSTLKGLIKASRNISRIYVCFWRFSSAKKVLKISTNLSSWPPLMWFLSTFFCFPPKTHVNRVLFGIAPQLQQECSNWSPRFNSHRPTREILELCRRSRIVPWRRRSSRSKWMWFPVARCDHWRGMENHWGPPTLKLGFLDVWVRWTKKAGVLILLKNRGVFFYMCLFVGPIQS